MEARPGGRAKLALLPLSQLSSVRLGMRKAHQRRCRTSVSFSRRRSWRPEHIPPPSLAYALRAVSRQAGTFFTSLKDPLPPPIPLCCHQCSRCFTASRHALAKVFHPTRVKGA